MASQYVLGVDLGTTFTAASVERDGVATVCTLGTRAQSIPTVVAVGSEGQILVGEPAERRGLTEPTQVAREFKRRLGDTTPLVLGTVTYTPQALMAHVLRHVVREVTVSEDGPPAEVVLTHPAHFGPYKRDLMNEVIRLADIDNARLITEPEAAAISYAQKSVIDPGRTVAVYDLGGGTFDAALVRRTARGGFELVGSADGIERLGGVDFDQALMELALDMANLSPDDLADAHPADVAALRQRCRDAKEALSTDSTADIAVGFGGADRVTVTRTQFEDLVRPRVLESVESLQRVIRSSGVSLTDIDRVLLVGGSSRIPLVAEIVRTRLALPVAVDANPKFAICTGAALSARAATPASSSASASDPTVALGASAGAAATQPITTTPPVPGPAGGSPASPAPPAPFQPAPPAATPSQDTKRRNGIIAAAALAVIGLIVGIIALTGGSDTKPLANGGTVAIGGTAPAPQITSPGTPNQTAPPAPAATQPPGVPNITTPPRDTVAVAPTAETKPAVAIDHELAATVFTSGSQWVFNKLTFDPAKSRVEIRAKVTSISRGRYEPAALDYSLRFDGSDLQLFATSDGTFSGAGASSTVTLATNLAPQNFDPAKALVVLGASGKHQAIVELGSGKVIEDLAAVAVPLTGTATTGHGVAYTAASAQIIPHSCGGGSERITFGPSANDEWSLLITGELVTGTAPTGGTTITGISGGYTRLKLPDGSITEATTTVDGVFGDNERHRDALICFGGLTAPGDGAYQLQILTDKDSPVGTIDFTIPPGAITADTPAPETTAPSEPGANQFAATVFAPGSQWVFNKLTIDPAKSRLEIRAKVTTNSRGRYEPAALDYSLRFDGSDLQLFATSNGTFSGAGASSTVTLSTTSLPDNFDPAKALVILGASGKHQAIVELGSGKVIEDLAAVPVTLTGTATTGHGVSYTAASAQIIPHTCDGGSERITFGPSANDEWSLLITGELVTGIAPTGGTAITGISGGYTRLKLPDGSTTEATSTVDAVLGDNERYRDALICFGGLTAPGDGAYQLQILTDKDSPVGTLDFTIPPGAIVADNTAS